MRYKLYNFSLDFYFIFYFIAFFLFSLKMRHFFIISMAMSLLPLILTIGCVLGLYETAPHIIVFMADDLVRFDNIIFLLHVYIFFNYFLL